MQENAPCKVPTIGRAKPKLFVLNWEFPNQTLRIMKLTAILLLAAVLQVSAKGFSQEKITISANNVPLEQVLNSIKKQSGYRFVYRQEHVSNIKVSIHVTNATLSEALDGCLKSQKLTYNIIGKSIVISPSEDGKTTNQENGENKDFPLIDIKGKVVNENGQAVQGVSVSVKGTSIFTLTDKNGDFSLNTIDENAILIFTHVSMETFEVNVSGKQELVVNLKTKISQLGDVTITVNTGYQDIPKERATGSFTKLDNSTLNQQVGLNILNRLDGVASGVLFPKQNLQGGPKNGFTIRGFSTINGPKEPLVVVDNFPYDGDINNINPNDVESITILKDAAAASIWGVRAGNGVVVITTKKGRFNQNMKVNVSSNVIVTKESDLSALKIISPSDYVDVETFLFNKGFYNSTLNNTSTRPAVSPVIEILAKRRSGLISPTDSAGGIDFYRTVDIRDEYAKHMYRDGVTQQYSINLSGGSGNFAYYLSGNYDKSIGELENKFNRYIIRSESIYKPLKNLQVSLAVQYAQSNTNNGKPSYGSIFIGSRLIPYLRFADEDNNPIAIANTYRETYTDTVGGGKLLNWKYYPLEDWKNNTTNRNQQDLLANIGINYQIGNGFSIDVKYLYERQTGTTKNLQNIESFAARNTINRFSQLNRTTGIVTYAVPLGGILNLSNDVMVSQNIRGQINYDRNWNNHGINTLVGGEIRQAHSTSNGGTYYGYNDDILTTTNVDLVNTYPTFINGSRTNIPGGFSFTDKLNRYVSLYGNLGYTYNSKYLFTLSGRRDASNLFGVNANNKWKPLWSVGAGWEISKESFFNLKWLPYLKVRTSYGFSGNTDPSKSGVTTLYYIGPQAPTNFIATRVEQFPNPELRWEKIGIFNFGLDFQGKRQLIVGSIEAFFKKGTDLLGAAPFDPTAGLNYSSTVIRNVANMKGSGIEVNINSKNINKELKWHTSLLFTYTENKTTDYYVDSNRRSNSFISSGSAISPIPGRPLYSIVGLNWAGLDANGNPQGYYNKDVSIDYSSIVNKTTKDDLIYKSALPRIFGSLINTFSYKGFSLIANINYRFGYFIMKPSLSYTNLYNFGAVIGSEDYANRWKNSGDENVTNVPSMIYPANNNRDILYNYAEVNILKADNIKLQYVNLSYDFGKHLLNKARLQQFQVYINASNLGILWKANKQGIDPDYISSPIVGKTYAMGVRATF